MAKPRNYNTARNLKNIDPDLYRLIDIYNINQQFLAKHVFQEEWGKAKGESKIEKMLTGRLRNKILGFGKLTPAEHGKIQECLAHVANDMQKTVESSIVKSKSEKKEIIRDWLTQMDEAQLDELYALSS